MLDSLELSPSVVYGNPDAQKLLCAAVRAKQFHQHTILLWGQKGVGKSSFAKRIAMVLLGAAQLNDDDSITIDQQSAAFRQMRQLSHPDFCYVSPAQFDNKSGIIPTEAREGLFAFLSRTGDSAHRIVIIDSLDDCAPSLLQALLKLLEEPPAKCLFLLVAHKKGRVPSTIISRTQQIFFNRLSEKEMYGATQSMLANSDKAQAAYCRFLAAGSPGMVCQLIDTDFTAIETAFSTMLDDQSMNSVALHDFAKLISHPKHDNLDAFRCWVHSFAYHTARATWVKPDSAPKNLQKLIMAAAPVLQDTSAQQIFQRTLDLLEKIQRPPAYLDAEATMVHIAYQWHGLFHTT